MPSWRPRSTTWAAWRSRRAQVEEAREFHERALAIREKALGADHPHVATSLSNLGNALFALAKPTEALAPLERALTIRTRPPARSSRLR